jgi:hypothetical protein
MTPNEVFTIYVIFFRGGKFVTVQTFFFGKFETKGREGASKRFSFNVT